MKVYEGRGGYSHGTIKCTEYEGRECPAVWGKVKNEGTKTLSSVEVTAYFPDKDGRIVFEKTFSPVLTTYTEHNPMRPGYIREFGYIVDDCPSECVPQRVELKVTKVEFVKAEESGD